jgi:ABC-type multidrug transport system fused ATPase/permease subunit
MVSTQDANSQNGHAPREQNGSVPAVEINNLQFTYPGLDGQPPPGMPPLIQDFSMSLQPGSRCLLIGANGAGKAMGGVTHVQLLMALMSGRLVSVPSKARFWNAVDVRFLYHREK